MRTVIMMLSTITCIEAKDLGLYGETFPVSERSLLEVIRAKLQALSDSGKLVNHQNIILQKTKERLNRPEPVLTVHKTTMPRSFAYDPSITVPYDLKDHEGRIFHRKGTRVNPLETRSMRCPLLFVDGDDEDQVDWATRASHSGLMHASAESGSDVRKQSKPKIILVKGSPFALSEKLGFPIYFDQSGALTKKLGITQVPARVSQKEKTLWVEELNPTAGSSPLPTPGTRR